MRDELVGEEVEQLGVARFVAAEAEIAGGGDEALAKVMVPEAVHDDAGGERVVGMGDPVREGESALGFGHLVVAKSSGSVLGP